MISCSQDKKAFLWDSDICEDIFEFKHLSAPVCDLVCFQNRVLLASKDGTFRVFSLDDGTLVRLFLTNKNSLSFALKVSLDFSSASKELFVLGSGDEDLLIYDMEQEKEQKPLVFKRSQYY